jgi:nicotinamidase-related amidase
MTARIWDRFLTEQDKAHLGRSRPKTRYGFGRKAAVLSVDNYRAAVGDERLPLLEAVELWPNASGLAGWEALDRIEVLFARARAAGVPVIHVTGMAQEDTGIPGWSSRRGGRAPVVRDDEAARDRHRRRYDIVEQAAPAAGEVVLTKTAPSAFFGTPLLAYLVSQGIDTLIVVGEAVSGCVRATVVDGCSNRLNMIVVEDCVYDRHEATRAMNLFDIDQKYGDVIGLDEALEFLGGDTEDNHEDGHEHGHGHGHGHGHHSHSEEREDETPVALPEIVTSRLPTGATPREVCLHQLSGHVVARAGQEVIDAAGAEMVTGFASPEHVVVTVRDGDLGPADDDRLTTALQRTEGGVLLIGVGYDAPAPVVLPKAPVKAACPECGSTEAEVVDAGDRGLVILGCADCGTVWDAVP